MSDNQTSGQLMNTAIENNFTVTFSKRPTLNFGVVAVVQPGVSIESRKVNQGGQTIKFIPVPNRSMDPVRESIQVTFNCQEDYSNYFEVFEWIKSYSDRTKKDDDLVTEIVIVQYDLSKRPVRKIILSNCFPTSLSSIDLTTSSSTATPIKFTSIFETTEINVEKM